MTITYIMGVYVLLYRRAGYYFTARTRGEVIDKAIYYLAMNK